MLTILPPASTDDTIIRLLHYYPKIFPNLSNLDSFNLKDPIDLLNILKFIPVNKK